MPEISALDFTLLAVMLIGGGVLGWIIRSNRAAVEKTTINLGWQEQLSAQRSEHERLVEQNKSLMQQISQYQASDKDTKNRTKELSESLKEAFNRRDELQRQIKDIRSNLEAAVSERDELLADIDNRKEQNAATANAIKERDEKIFKLSRELESWQDRLPPLIEKFRERNEAAERLERELAASHDRIDALEKMIGSDQTRVQPVDRDTLRDSLDASNEPIEATGISASLVSQSDDLSNVTLIEEIEASMRVAAFDEGSSEKSTEPEASVNDSPESAYTANDSDPIGGLRDNLKKIKGIGPAIEKTLNEMGIFRFNQIAEMSEYDIDRVANRLRGFHSRIYREDWIGQARELHDRKVNGQA